MQVMDLFNLKGKVVLITGGSIGLGRQMARGLAEAGANLVLCARKLERCLALEEQLEKELGVEVLSVACDVSKENQVATLVESALQQFGKIDVLINNAGLAVGMAPEDMPLNKWERVLQVNLTGTFLCSQYVGREMIKAGSGKIINITSIAGFGGSEVMNAISYSSSKGAVITFTKDLAVKWAKYNVHVNAVAPGYFPTQLADPLIAAASETILSRVPLGRLGGDDDLKGVVIFLASRASDYITGHIIPVDGGQLAWSS